jgi:hypothetical protein
MARGSRYNATTGDTDIKLLFQFTLNGVATDPYSWDRVEIYDNYDDALSNTNPMETIETANITDIGDGLVEYVITTPVDEGTYFDKVYLTPKDGASQIYFIASFYVREEDYGGGPSELPQRCQVSGYLFDAEGQPVVEGIVSFKLQQPGEPDDTYHIIAPEKKFVLTNEVGFFSISLIRSTVFNPNIQYDIEIRYGSHRELMEKTIPDQAGVNFNDL